MKRKNIRPALTAALAVVSALAFFATAASGTKPTRQTPAPAPEQTLEYRYDGEVAARKTSSLEPETAPEAIAHPFTDEEVTMLAKTIWAEARGVPSLARQAAVGWCALNRLDDGTFGSTLAEVLSTPKQFAYYEASPATLEMLELSEDVLSRWYAEHLGNTDVGRTLPSDYLYFEGDGEENHFRKKWRGAEEEWTWALDDPYEYE